MRLKCAILCCLGSLISQPLWAESYTVSKKSSAYPGKTLITGQALKFKKGQTLLLDKPQGSCDGPYTGSVGDNWFRSTCLKQVVKTNSAVRSNDTSEVLPSAWAWSITSAMENHVCYQQPEDIMLFRGEVHFQASDSTIKVKQANDVYAFKWERYSEQHALPNDLPIQPETHYELKTEWGDVNLIAHQISADAPFSSQLEVMQYYCPQQAAVLKKVQ